MVRLAVVADRSTQSERLSRSGPSIGEGEAAKMLMESNGYPAKSTLSSGQYQFRCPFHEEPGSLNRQSTNFYLDSKTSQYYCQAASCSEKGNLQTLEKFFGVASDPTAFKKYTSLEQRLKQAEAQLPVGDLRQPFYDKGLTDATIEKFRYGWEPAQPFNADGENSAPTPDRYVIPYLEGRRPIAFRYYSPSKQGPNGTKYWWEQGSDARLYNATDGVGHQVTGEVFICEGELKAALLCQMGYCAVAVPGASQWKTEWSQAFNHSKHVYVCFDNDSPETHNYDKINKDGVMVRCRMCSRLDRPECVGHNPGQESAARLLDIFGSIRSKNVVLPRAEGMPKTDINEYFLRDGATREDFAALALGHGKTSPFIVRSLKDIHDSPPEEAVFLVDQGLLPKGGRLLVSGAPKVGKSIFVENLALSIAAGIPFLRRFNIANTNPTPGHRVLLLDRELSERSLYDRLNALIEERPGYAAAEDKILIDHRMPLRLDDERAAMQLVEIIQANQAEVIILDTAYKFFSGDMESSKNVSKALASLDEAIKETGVSVILTHHHRKSGAAQGGKEALPHPDQVVGSFLWTGWPNGTVLLNFLNRRVESPFNTVASFVAFRDAAPPEPLKLLRGRESISYSEVVNHVFEDEDSGHQQGGHTRGRPLNYDEMATFLLECTPVQEEDFLHMAAGVFKCKQDTARLVLMDIMDRHPDFTREGDGSRNKPYLWKFKYHKEEELYVEPEMEQIEMGIA